MGGSLCLEPSPGVPRGARAGHGPASTDEASPDGGSPRRDEGLGMRTGARRHGGRADAPHSGNARWSSPGKSGGPGPGNQVVLTSGNRVGPNRGNQVVLNRGNRVVLNRGNFPADMGQQSRGNFSQQLIS